MNVTIDSGPAAADIKRWAHNLPADVVPALSTHAARVVDRTRSSLPRHTGRLASSAHVQTTQDGATAAMSAPYARFVEFGGRGHPHSSTGNYMGAAARGLEPQLAPAAATAAEQSIGRFPWSKA